MGEGKPKPVNEFVRAESLQAIDWPSLQIKLTKIPSQVGKVRMGRAAYVPGENSERVNGRENQKIVRKVGMLRMRITPLRVTLEGSVSVANRGSRDIGL